jgi:hypothetical protein
MLLDITKNSGLPEGVKLYQITEWDDQDPKTVLAVSFGNKLDPNTITELPTKITDIFVREFRDNIDQYHSNNRMIDFIIDLSSFPYIIVRIKDEGNYTCDMLNPVVKYDNATEIPCIFVNTKCMHTGVKILSMKSM